MSIEPLIATHWPQVSTIYDQGISTSLATFETKIPTWDYWNNNHLQACRLVAIENQIIQGWAALSRVSSRPVYCGVFEVSIYLEQHSRGKGLGIKLLNTLIEKSELHQIWTLQAIVFPENKASVQLHKNCGFREVGIRERIGKLNGKWISTMLLERRSTIIFP